MSKFSVLFVSFALFFVALGGVSSGTEGGKEGGKVVVTVNGATLTEADLNQEIQIILPTEAGFHGRMSDEKMKVIRTKALASLVEKELQYQDAIAHGGKLAKEALAAEVEKVKVKYSKKGDFKKILLDAGFSPESFNALMERKVLSERVKLQMVDEKVQVTDDIVKAFFEKNKEKYLKPQEFRASQILVKVRPSATVEEKNALKEKAQSLLKQVAEGADFARLAEKESDDLSSIKGGDLGYFHLGQTTPEFEEAITKLKVGETSGIIETLDGFHIVKLSDKKDTHQMQLEEMKDKITAQLKEKEGKRLFDQWMDGLKSKAKIAYPEG